MKSICPTYKGDMYTYVYTDTDILTSQYVYTYQEDVSTCPTYKEICLHRHYQAICIQLLYKEVNMSNI